MTPTTLHSLLPLPPNTNDATTITAMTTSMKPEFRHYPLPPHTPQQPYFNFSQL
ncbi:hypothetical protein HanRHA438_Chr12g0557341 [Helianthus annuus]|nr:hypothetical protein HanRHA438_Chr12g0557341 [Helianthus annuus]